MVIKVPDNIDIVATRPDGSQVTIPTTFSQFLIGRLDDSAFGRSSDTLEARASLRKAFEGAEPGKEVDVRRSDWDTLVQATRTPAAPYIPAIGEQVLPFIGAILNAK